MRVAITRPIADAELFAKALHKTGVEPVLEPLMSIDNIEGPSLDLSRYQALLITSANGARALKGRTSERNIRVFAVGDASTQAAIEAGFQNVESAGGDVETLAQLIINRLSGGDGPLLHVAGTRVAGDLSGVLSRTGFDVRREVLYRASFISSFSSQFVQELEVGNIDGVTLFSPRTASAFVELAKKSNVTNLNSVTAYCLSQAVAEKALDISWKNIIVAETPDQASLLTEFRP
jgi:uroporphyrinogen-III synthase